MAERRDVRQIAREAGSAATRAGTSARHALDRGDISVAYRLASVHSADSGLVFAESEWLAGWIALRFLDDYKAAYGHFTTLFAGTDSPISRGRGAWFSSRCAFCCGC